MRRALSILLILLIIFIVDVILTNAQGGPPPSLGGFTYQGSLKDAGVPLNGTYDMKFEYFQQASGGTSLGTEVMNVTVTNGLFNVLFTADIFSSLWRPGAAVWIQTSLRPTGSSSPYATLAPRQRIYSAPFAVSSLLAADSERLGGVAANQFITTTTGVTTFIQNGSAQQSGGFNLDGTGSANVINAATQFNIGGNRVLSAGGSDNIFAGFQAGQNTTSGASNAFFGVLAGSANSSGNFNSFFGRSAGSTNSTGNANSFFGSSAGGSTSSGGGNSFFGFDAGNANSTGSNNTVIGGAANVIGNNLTNATAIGFRAAVSQNNSLVLGSINGINGANVNTNVGIGTTAPTASLDVNGVINTSTQYNISGGRILSAGGSNNLFLGYNTGNFNSTGSGNSFAGAGAGVFNQSGSGNSYFGNNAGVNRTGSNNSVFGSGLFYDDELGLLPGDFNSFFGHRAGAFSHGGLNTFLGTGAGTRPAGSINSGSSNTFVGHNAGNVNSSGSFNTVIGENANVASPNLTNATAIGSKAFVGTSNSLVLGSINSFNGATADTNVGIGTTTPQYRLHIVGENLRVDGGSASTLPRFSLNYTGGGADAKKWQNYAAAGALNFTALSDNESAETIWMQVNRGTGTAISSILFPNGNIGIGVSSPDKLAVNGTISFATLGAAGGTQLCRNASNQIAACSSSLRYKKNIDPFSQGMSLVNKLRPIAYEWKTDGIKDVGFGAEDVAKIDPRFVTYNDKGEVEGVKYDRLSVAFVNAFKEQQTQIETQQKQLTEQQKKLERQQSEIDALKAIVCAANSSAPVCKMEEQQ